MRRCVVASTLGLSLLAAHGCRRDAPAAPAREEAAAPAPVQRASVPSQPAPLAAAVAPDKPALEQALAWLSEAVREPAGDPENPWALAHGLLAFGQGFETRDGRDAVDVVAAFARPVTVAGVVRHGFPASRAGKPVEPHPHLLVKTFLEVGVERSRRLRVEEGREITLQRLLDDMHATSKLPVSDEDFHQLPWRLYASELDARSDARRQKAHAEQLTSLRLLAFARLESDSAVLGSLPSADPFAAHAPMGKAKREKTQIYGHPCGGLHLLQALLRAADGSRDARLQTRARAQLGLLVSRYEAERVLYATSLVQYPQAALLLYGQQLKFFGHVLETFALADELRLLEEDANVAAHIRSARGRVAGDLLEVIASLRRVRAYEQLSELATDKPQLHLDLIGDGCHAVHGLRELLALLP